MNCYFSKPLIFRMRTLTTVLFITYAFSPSLAKEYSDVETARLGAKLAKVTVEAANARLQNMCKEIQMYHMFVRVNRYAKFWGCMYKVPFACRISSNDITLINEVGLMLNISNLSVCPLHILGMCSDQWRWHVCWRQ